jgi:hemoglobin-like flavoprotein
MYVPVGDSLVEALAEALGDDWSPQAEAQWVAAYTVVADLMCPAAAIEAAE